MVACCRFTYCFIELIIVPHPVKMETAGAGCKRDSKSGVCRLPRNGGRRLWRWAVRLVLQIQLVINPARLSVPLTFGEWIPGKFLLQIGLLSYYCISPG
jgi:hypothetical protein